MSNIRFAFNAPRTYRSRHCHMRTPLLRNLPTYEHNPRSLESGTVLEWNMAIGDEHTLRGRSSFQPDSFLSSLRPRVFLLGGLTFLGRNSIQALLKAGYDINSIATTSKEKSALQAFGCSAVKIGDPRSLDSVRLAAQGCQYPVHCASKFAHYDTSRREKLFFWNTVIVQNVLQACIDLRIVKLVVQSSDAVLFDGRPLRDADESYPYSEHPLGVCAKSMQAVERIVIAANSEQLKTVVVRPRLLWGCNEEHFLRSLLHRARRGNLRLVNDGHFLTSTCHVRNACEGIVLALRSSESGCVYFLTDGKPVLFRTFVESLLRASGMDNRNIALKPGLPLWLAPGFAWIAEILAYISGAYPFVSRAGVGMVGQQMTFSGGEARRKLGYKGKFTREEGYSEIMTNCVRLVD